MSSYRALLARPLARQLAASSGVGWWAFNGYGLALVLAIEHATGSFAVAGGATAAFGAGSAVFAPMRGRAVDRGGARMLLWLAAVHCAAMAVVLAAAASGASPTWLVLAASGAGGASAPPLTALARRTWPLVAGPELARTSHALNAVLGETAAIASPLAVSVLAVAASPALALGVLLPGTAAAAAGIAATARAMSPPTEGSWAVAERPPTEGSWVVAESPSAPGQSDLRSPCDARRRSLLRESPGLRWLMAGDIATGLWLGGLEVAAPALSADAGTRLLAGAPFVALAVGGIIASLWSGSGHARGGPVDRYLWGSLAAAAVLPLALLVPMPGALACVAVAAGLAYGVINVALFELVDRVADERQSVEAFTWITTAQASGLAIGAATAGALADAEPAQALLVVAGGPLAGALAALGGRRTLQTQPTA